MNDLTRHRRDGWTAERQARFLTNLEQTGSVRAAAAAAGMSRTSAYRLRDRPSGRGFGRAWDAALLQREQRLFYARLAKVTPATRNTGHYGHRHATKDDFSSGEGDKGHRFPQNAPHHQLHQQCHPRTRRSDHAALWAAIDAASR